MGTRELGDLGEKLACEYLVKKGFKILGKNYRITFGEIDIVAKKPWKLFANDKTIHFVEVKTIAANGGSFFPEQHVDYRKQRKLRQLAQIWLRKNGYPQDVPYQIDIIGVLVDCTARNAQMHYFPSAISD